MTTTSKKEIGNHRLASFLSRSRYLINLSDLDNATQPTHTTDWIVRRRKFIEKWRPETTNLLMTVMSILAAQYENTGSTGLFDSRSILLPGPTWRLPMNVGRLGALLVDIV